MRHSAEHPVRMGSIGMIMMAKTSRRVDDGGRLVTPKVNDMTDIRGMMRDS